jgi:hypothetical protein
MRTLTVAAALSLTSIIANTASAQCEVEETVDQVTMTTTTAVVCQHNEGEFAVFNCLSSGDLVIGLFPGEFIGGDSSRVIMRGDAQSEPYSFQSGVGNDGQWLRTPASSFLPIIQAFQSSTQVFIRYMDYRDVSHDFIVSATNFTSASSQLACVTSLLERAAEREAQAADGEAIRAEMEARGCEMRKEGWVCPD